MDRSTDIWPGEHVDVAGIRLYQRRVPDPEAVDPEAVDPEAADPKEAGPGALGTGRAGAGRATMVYLHGLGGSSINWTDLGYLLGPDVDGYALDLPGFGFSDPPERAVPPRDYSLDSTADIVAEYLARFPGPVHLVGNSLGGAIAVRVAARVPVQSLTLISPAFPDLRPRIRRLRYLPLALVRIPVLGPAAFRRATAVHPERQVDATFREIFFAEQPMGPVRREQAITQARERAEMPWAGNALAASFLALVRSWIVGDHWAVAATVTAPTLIVWGARDLLVSAALAPRVTRAFADARLVMFPNVGHVAQMEVPGAVAAEIRALLSRA